MYRKTFQDFWRASLCLFYILESYVFPTSSLPLSHAHGMDKARVVILNRPQWLLQKQRNSEPTSECTNRNTKEMERVFRLIKQAYNKSGA